MRTRPDGSSRGLALRVPRPYLAVFLLALLIAFLPGCGKKAGSSGEPEMEPVTEDERAMVVERVSELLAEYYVFPDVAEECAEIISTRLAEGAYDDIERPNLFARALNEDLQSVNGDEHLRVVAIFGVEPESEDDAAAALRNELDHLHFMVRGNYGIIRAEWLRGNVGYLDLRAFPSLYVAREKIVATMRFLSDMDAIIIDLRDEVMGGPPETVQFVMSYFFDEPMLYSTVYFRKDNVKEEFWTLEDVPGPRMADVPLYVLTDENVFSAGEGFTHALQALGRATVIGETTGGGAHITRPFMIGERFEAKIPWARAINPITGTNWEGVGVTPDVEVPSDEALDVALEMAREAVVARREERETAGFATLDDVIEKIRGAEESLRVGDLVASRSTLWGALALGIDSGVLHEGLVDDIGYHYLDRGEVDMAIEVFSFAAETYPKSHNAFYSLAEAYVKKGNAALAESSLARSLELRPGGAWAVKLLTNIDEEIRKAREE